jgi:hypothetical protein
MLPASLQLAGDGKKEGLPWQPFFLLILISFDTNASLSAIRDVHRDFEAKTHFGEFGFGPHSRSPR